MKALVYPTSYVKNLILEVVNPLFSKIIAQHPTEKTPVVGSTKDTGASGNIPQIEAFCPRPLGEDLDTFKHIIRSYTVWAEHLGLGFAVHGEELMRFSVADPESVSELIRQLKGRGEEDSLLDARIFLELSYMLDQREDDLKKELGLLKRKEMGIKRLISGPEVEEDLSTFQDQWIEWKLPPLAQPKKRLCAWTRLFLEADSPMPLVIPFGEGRETRDLVECFYERRFKGKTPKSLFSIPVDPEMQLPEQKREEVVGLFSDLLKALFNAPDEIGTLSMAREFSDLWTSINPQLRAPLSMDLMVYPGDLMECISTECGLGKGTHTPLRGIRFSLFLV